MAAKTASGANDQLAAKHSPRAAGIRTQSKIDAARARRGRFASVSSNQHRKLKRLRSGYGLRQNSRIGAFKNECGGPKEPGEPCQICRPLLVAERAG